jgi:hypothetical protein
VRCGAEYSAQRRLWLFGALVVLAAEEASEETKTEALAD